MARLFVDVFRDAVWASEDLSTAERLLLLAMAEFCTWETGEDCKPGATVLGQMMGKDPRTVKKLRRGLEPEQERSKTVGVWLAVVRRGSMKGATGQTSEYRLLIPNMGRETPASDFHKGRETPSDMGRETPGGFSTGGVSNTDRGRFVQDLGRDATQPPLTTRDHRAEAKIDEQFKAVAAQFIQTIRGDAA